MKDQEIEIIVKPRSAFSLGIRDLVYYRELIYIFAWREIKVRYKQAVLGFLWVVLQPLILMFIISTFLSKALGTNLSGKMPYHLFVFSGLILWQLFLNIVNNSTNNLLANANVIKKIYFPRLIIPISSVISSLFDFGVSFATLIVFLLFTSPDIFLHFNIFYFLFSLLITILSGLTMGIFFSALVVKYRDFRYTLPFVTQFLFFSSPVIYDVESRLAGSSRYLYSLNPLVITFELFRKSFSGEAVSFGGANLFSVGIAILFFFVSIYLFRKMEEYIADMI